MNINQLKYFIAVADHRSFTNAAKQYYLSQTAITQQIQALEEAVGVQLINRNSRPISLTPAGHSFYLESKGIIARMDTALRRANEASKGLSGTLRIGYIKSYENSDLVRKIIKFKKDFPNVFVSAHRGTSDALEFGLLNNEYDIIYTWDSSNIQQEGSVKIQQIDKVPLVVLLYTEHPFAQKTVVKRKDLKGEKLFFMTPSSNGYSFADAHYVRLYQEAGFQPDIVLRTDDLENILLMVSAEEGISIVPEYCKHQIGAFHNLMTAPMDDPNEYEEVLAAWKTDNENPALMHYLDIFN